MITKFEKEIIEKLKQILGYDAPPITQEQFDNMVDYIIKTETNTGNYKELLWRLCGCYEGLNFNKVIDNFVDSKDYYTSELVSYVDGNLEQEYLVKKMIETNDIDYIKKSLESCGGCMQCSLSEENNKILKEFIRARMGSKL